MTWNRTRLDHNFSKTVKLSSRNSGLQVQIFVNKDWFETWAEARLTLGEFLCLLICLELEGLYKNHYSWGYNEI